MEVFESKLKVYACKDIKSEDSLTCISELMDKSFLKDGQLSKFHEENSFKWYNFNSFFPVELSKIYKAGNIYTIIIRTIDKKLAEHFQKVLVNEYTNYLKALTIETRNIPKKHISKIYSITPTVMKFNTGYWKGNETIETFERRIVENLIKKYNSYFNTKLSEDFELFTYMKFENQKPIATKFKNIKILGDKLTLNVAENSTAQDLAYLALGTGLGEMGSRGFGFINFKWM